MKKMLKFLKENRKIIIPIAIIAVPVIIFVIILIIAAVKSGTVIVGNRYRNDLEPSIKKADIQEVQSSVSSLSNVDSVEINLETSQFRVMVDASDSITKEDAEILCKSVYDKVNSCLPISTYFTKDNQGKKMYDLEITVFNSLDKDSDLIIYTLVKNSTMEEYILENPSSAKDPELVEELRIKEEERKNPTVTTPETTPQFKEELDEDDLDNSLN